MPQMICVECLNHVTSACETKRKCIDADASLRNVCNESKSVRLQKPEEVVTVETIEIQRLDVILIQDETRTGEKEAAFVHSEEPNDEAANIVESRKRSARQTRQSKGKLIEPIGNSQLTVKREKLEGTQSIVYEEKFKCEKCEKHFESALELRNHTRLIHPKEGNDFYCDLCSFVSKRKKNVERHILAVHMKSHKFSCPFNKCNRQYTTQAALKLHTVRDHDESSPYECQKCHQKFSCDSLMKIHSQRLSCRPRIYKSIEKKAAEKSLQCPHCEFKTAHQFSLTQHVNLIHLNIRKTFKCSHCKDIEFSNRISLSQHLLSVHGLSHIRCKDCDQAFSNQEQLKSHKESLKCNSRKATEDDYEESESGVRCVLCERSYRSKKEWITHYFNHHKFNKVCDICNVQLSTYASLKNHKKTIHEKIKAFACTECPKKFSAKHTLDFHLNSHSGLKPFSCKFCSFKASDRSSVSKHQKKLHPETTSKSEK